MTPTENGLPTARSGGAVVARSLQLLAAAGVALGGGLHLQIWYDSKRKIPGQVPGVWVVQEGFVANAATSALVAAMIVVAAFGPRIVVQRAALVTGLLVELGSIAGLVASRGGGVFGWSEKGWDGDAKRVLTVEIVAALVAVGALAWSVVKSSRRSPTGPADSTAA